MNWRPGYDPLNLNLNRAEIADTHNLRKTREASKDRNVINIDSSDY